MKKQTIKDNDNDVSRRVRVVLSAEDSKKVCDYAKLYRTSPQGMVSLILAFYFGDGDNHLSCEFCRDSLNVLENFNRDFGR